MKRNKNLELQIELVPLSSWWGSFRNKIPRKKWDEIRKKIYSKYGYKCGICGAKGRLNCHEIWEFDDEKHVQKLIDFIPLCNRCHFVKHIGMAEILASEGRLSYERIVEHFMKINRCGRETFERHKREAFTKWSERSKYEWKIDLGKHANMIPQKA